jgi:hypothetical protein
VFIADEGSEHDLPADLVIFAMGFAHPEYDGVVAELGLELDNCLDVAPVITDDLDGVGRVHPLSALFIGAGDP